MRFLELSLLAYGAFRDRRFDLSAPPPAMHVLYGANEAGKSTALRAILGLLYGIERRTPDAYLHGNANLRIGARLCDAAGHELNVVRRKGDKDTLLDAQGAVLDETQLQRLLGGMQEGVFRSMFGLDHARLRKGGEQLRLGQGDLGESLFQAGVGAPGLSVVLRELGAQADELFRPRGKRLLNGEIDAFRKAQRAISEHGKRAESLRLQEQELDAVEEQRWALQRRRNELLEEQGRLGRVKRVLPKLAQRRELLERRAQIGEQPLLPDDSDEQRRKAQAERFACESQLVQLDRAHAGATQRSAALVIPEGMLELSADYVRAIRNRLGGILKAEEDLPSRRAELRALEHDARAALRALAEPVKLEEVGALRVEAGTAALIGKLAREHGGLRERLDAALRDEEAGHEALRRAARELSPLQVASGAAGPLDSLALPSQASLEAIRGRFERAESAREKLDDAFAALEQREALVEQELDRIAREGSPPSERELADARAVRDRLWIAIRAGEQPAAADLDEYARLTQAADAIADRLRREASRVAELARREAEREALARERDRLVRRAQEHTAAAEALDAAWSALFAPLGLRPRTVAEMQPLLAKVAALLESGERGREEAARRRAEADAALVRWQAQWAELMARLRLRPDASVEEAQAVHDEQRRLLEKAERMSQLRDRIQAMERDRRNFEADVRAIATHHLPELAELPIEQAAEQLVRRHAEAQRDRELRASIARELGEIEAQRAQLRDRDERAERVLQELLRTARAADLAELEQIEQRCRQLRALERELAGVDHDLLEFGEGAGIDELAAQAAEQSGERVRARLEELREELEAQEGDRQELDHKIGRLRQGLELVKRDDLAAQSAAEAEQHLARIKGYAHTYVRKRLAVELLERELRRYRDANQGPIVGRASALFARLTLSRYPRLEVGYDEADAPVLQCVDEQGTRVSVEGLSDGARDQLYLALRLASLERFAERNEPMPLVLDDVLIHFDEQRARAALAVLADFSATAQVLFFTHSARLCELAREAVPPGQLFEHRLGDAQSVSSLMAAR